MTQHSTMRHKMLARIWLILVLFIPAWPAVAADVEVSGGAALVAAIAAAKPGDVLLLNPGSYDQLALDGTKDSRLSFEKMITITAKDKSHPPVFGKIALRGVANITLSGLALRYIYRPGDTVRGHGMSITDSTLVTLKDMDIEGDNARNTQSAADGFGFGIAISVLDSNHVRVDSNRIKTWHRGGVFANSHDLSITNNELQDLRSDGLDFAGVTDVEVSGNHLHGFRRSPDSKDHPDMIQFWTRNTKLQTKNLMINGNFLDAGGGDWTQSIFMRNEEVDHGKAGREMYYENVTIQDNVIRNAQLHGITVGEVDGLTISHNTIVQSASSKERGNVSVPLINISKAALNVRITNNIFPRISQSLKKAPADWIVEGNVTAQRDVPIRPDYVSNVFANALVSGEARLSDLAILPDSDAAKMNAGSSLTAFSTHPREDRLYVTSIKESVSGDQRTFSVSGAFGKDGPFTLKGANIKWDFGDGQSGSGPSSKHTYAGFGSYVVTATVKLANGRTLSTRYNIEVGMRE